MYRFLALNSHNPNATIDDGSCIAVVSGCTDSTAVNYDPSANMSDNSCTYCYAAADINNGLDTTIGCDSALIIYNFDNSKFIYGMFQTNDNKLFH